MHEQQPAEPTELSRRTFLRGAFGAAATLALSGCGPDKATDLEQNGSQSMEDQPSTNTEVTAPAGTTDPEAFILSAAEAMLAAGEESHGGLRYPSKIQDGNYQTDRDVGASGVGMGFLILAKQYPQDGRWLDGAIKTATWLEAVSKTDKDGRYWNDYVNDDETSESAYASFDDGTIGISDFYWQLYELTNDPRHKQIAIEGLQWTMAQAKNTAEDNAEAIYSWQWDMAGSKKDIRSGMGEGMSGIIHALASFYKRLKENDPNVAAQCKQYAIGGERYLVQVQKDLNDQLVEDSGYHQDVPGVLPEKPYGSEGDTAMNSGYLSGAAGTAIMYLKLAQVFGKDADGEDFIDKAAEYFDWLENDQEGPLVKIGADTSAWKLMVDPEGGDDDQYATGFEEGAAGIGWSALQAHELTGDARYLDMARKAGNWLISVTIQDGHGGLSWAEDEHPRSDVVHTNLNNGAAGIAQFLYDLGEATGEQIYTDAAHKTGGWIMRTAVQVDGGFAWKDNEDGNDYIGDMTWHWGSSGVISALVRMQGGTTDIPGMQPALVRA